ncbi:UvrABC system protein B [anaerobic digester metagenome]
MLTGEILGTRAHISIFPASHYVTSPEKLRVSVERIEAELKERLDQLRRDDKLLEAQRLEQRTNYDLEMMREMGFCTGIENYSRHLSLREPGSTPFTLIDFFPDDFLMIADESHVSIPQIRGMYEGDRSRKTTLVDFGFRLPSALDNRPLKFVEFEDKINQLLFVSATPSVYEKDHTEQIAEQIIRPTGLLDPEISVRPIEGQIDNLLSEVKKTTSVGQKVLVTTLTKKMAERLTDYLREAGVRVRYLHSDIDTLERLEIIRDLRMDVFDVLVGINLLREGLDIPEVSLVAILDADKEGFLRSETSLIQTVGRAARNKDGRVIMYANVMTESMNKAIRETNRRRSIQEEYNELHGITPQTIQKKVHDIIQISKNVTEKQKFGLDKDPESMSKDELKKLIQKMDKDMKQAAVELQFERAAELRDKVLELKRLMQE